MALVGEEQKHAGEARRGASAPGLDGFVDSDSISMRAMIFRGAGPQLELEEVFERVFTNRE